MALRRFGAAIIDSIICVLPTLILVLILYPKLGIIVIRILSRPFGVWFVGLFSWNLTYITISLISIGFYFLYFPLVTILMHGRTFGKRLFNLSIKKTDGTTLNNRTIFAREIIKIIYLLFPIVFFVALLYYFVNPKRLYIHDAVFKTQCIYCN